MTEQLERKKRAKAPAKTKAKAKAPAKTKTKPPIKEDMKEALAKPERPAYVDNRKMLAVPPEVHEEVRLMAEATGASMASIVGYLVERYSDEVKEDEAL